MSIKKVIFDCDGVLIDSEIVAAEVVTKSLEDLGTSIHIEDYLRNHSGKTFRDIIVQLNIKLPYSIETFISNAEQLVYEDIRPIQGIKSVLNSINLPKAVVSNSHLEQVRKSIESTDIAHHFEERCFSASMVKEPKPSPMVYQLAADTLSVRPEECLVVEDSKSGVKAAVAANMNVIGFCGGSHILNDHDKTLLSLGAKETAMNTQELITIINQFM